VWRLLSPHKPKTNKKMKNKLNPYFETTLDRGRCARLELLETLPPRPLQADGFLRKRVRAGTVGFIGVLMRALILWLPATLLGNPVTVIITVDNGYGFGFGDAKGIYDGQYYGGIDNCSALQISYQCYESGGSAPDTGPEVYHVDANFDNYIYIVSWSDDHDYQGTVASFTDDNTGITITTSPNPKWPWEVFATGINQLPNCTGSGTHGPLLAAINDEITTADAGTGGPGSSVGWVGVNGDASRGLTHGRLDFSGQYGHAYPYSVPSCIGSGAKWMEYNPEPANSSCNPFVWNSTGHYQTIPNFLREYHIYRIGPLGPVLGGSSTNACTNDCITIHTPNDIVTCTRNDSMPVNYQVWISDTCTNDCKWTADHLPNSDFPLGTTVVTITATDGLGNTNTCTFKVTVNYCPEMIALPANNGVVIDWKTNGSSYWQVQCSYDLVHWTNFGTSGIQPPIIITPALPVQFYRLIGTTPP